VNLEFLFFFSLFEKMGRSDNGKRNILLGWPYDCHEFSNFKRVDEGRITTEKDLES